MASFFQDLLATIADRGRKLVQPAAPDEANVADLASTLLAETGEASGVALAETLLSAYAGLTDAEKREYFEKLSAHFGTSLSELDEAVAAYQHDRGARTAQRLHAAAEPRRQELLRRLNSAAGGTSALVNMRADLLKVLADTPELAPVDDDFHHLFQSWFNRGFLVLRQIEWSTPASILERIIRYEAVHEISSWDDLRNRTEPSDRRCYAFFHPALGDEPLIFVEVALTRGIPSEIEPVLSPYREQHAAMDADTAVFYSISNCQKGLRGVSFGNFLIKQVVQELSRELPDLKTFVTLSPVPGFSRWLAQFDGFDGRAISDEDGRVAEEHKDALIRLAVHYLLEDRRPDGRPHDPVERFHLGNGARLEQVNWNGDLSTRGLAQSHGLMVNYLYDPAEIVANHETFIKKGKIVASPSVRKLAKSPLPAIASGETAV